MLWEPWGIRLDAESESWGRLQPLCLSKQASNNRLLGQKLKEQYGNASPTSQMPDSFKCIFSWMRKRFCLSWEMVVFSKWGWYKRKEPGGWGIDNTKHFCMGASNDVSSTLRIPGWHLCHIQSRFWNTVAPRADKSTVKLSLLVDWKANSCPTFLFFVNSPNKPFSTFLWLPLTQAVALWQLLCSLSSYLIFYFWITFRPSFLSSVILEFSASPCIAGLLLAVLFTNDFGITTFSVILAGYPKTDP